MAITDPEEVLSKKLMRKSQEARAFQKTIRDQIVESAPPRRRLDSEDLVSAS